MLPSERNDKTEPMEPALAPRHVHRERALLFALLLGCSGAYLLAAYLVVPALWHRHQRVHPASEGLPRRAVTKEGIPGDPINVTVVGSEDELQRLMLRAGWVPADATTLRSALRIATASIIRRPYASAPVSGLFVWGRRQDLAFERPAGSDPRRRHHVRFWRSAALDADGRPLWAGAATFDTRAGVSHLTGQVTHHIERDVDRERDKLVADLLDTGAIDVSWNAGFQQQLESRNGGGDPYFTDGRLAAVNLRAAAADGGT